MRWYFFYIRGFFEWNSRRSLGLFFSYYFYLYCIIKKGEVIKYNLRRVIVLVLEYSCYLGEIFLIICIFF